MAEGRRGGDSTMCTCSASRSHFLAPVAAVNRQHRTLSTTGPGLNGHRPREAAGHCLLLGTPSPAHVPVPMGTAANLSYRSL
eukprot:364188-Chlamydomonas_euryale.AAC.2